MPTFKNRTTADISIKRLSQSNDEWAVETVLTVPITKQSSRVFKLMERDDITLVFSLKDAVHFQVGDFINDQLFGTFVLKEEQTPNFNKNTGGYDYQLVFVAPCYIWDNHEFTLTNGSSGTSNIERQECSWVITDILKANIKEFIRCLNAIQEEMPESLFSPFCHNGLPYVIHIHSTASHRDEVCFMTYDSLGMTKALNAMAEAWRCEWWVTYEVPSASTGDILIEADAYDTEVTGNTERGVIHFGKCEGNNTPYIFSERAISNVTDITVEGMTAQRNDSEHANRLFVLGGARNLPESYRKTLVLWVESSTWEGRKTRHLYLPNRRLTQDMLGGASVSTQTVSKDMYFNSDTHPDSKDLTHKMYVNTQPWKFTGEGTFTNVKLNAVHICVEFPDTNNHNWVLKGNLRIYHSVGGKDELIYDWNDSHSASNPFFQETYNPSYSGNGKYHCFGVSSPAYAPSSPFEFVVDGVTDAFNAIKVEVVFTTDLQGAKIINDYSPYKTQIIGYTTCTYEERTSTNRINLVLGGVERTFEVMFNPENNGRPASDSNIPEENYYYHFALYKDENGNYIDDSNYNNPILHADQDQEQAQKFTLLGYNPVQIPLSWYTDIEDSPLSQVGLGERRLRLPMELDQEDEDEYVNLCGDYVELVEDEDMEESERVELTVKNDNIYPQCYLKVTEVTPKKNQLKEVLSDGSPVYWPYDLYYLKVTLLDGSEFPFRSSFANDEKLKALFISEMDEYNAYAEEGETQPSTSNRFLLAGMEFECEWDDSDKTLKILTNKDYGAMLPNDTLKPSVNDTIVLTGWDVRAMEELGLIAKAERRLWQFACAYIKELKTGQFTITCDMMSGWAESIHSDNNKGLHIGNDATSGQTPKNYVGNVLPKMLLPLEGSKARVYNDSLLGGSMLSRILGYEFKLDYPFDTPKYTIGETDAYSRIKNLEKNLTKAGSGGGRGTVSYNGGSYGGGSSSGGEIPSLSDLLDVEVSNPSENNVLIWNGTRWVNGGNIKELVFVDFWESQLIDFNATIWDGEIMYYRYQVAKQEGGMTSYVTVKEVIPLNTETVYIDKQHNTPYRWDGEQMQPLSQDINISASNGTITINDVTLNLVHNHDWSDLVNKPNLVEGVLVGNNKLSFKWSNGDIAEIDFSALVDKLDRRVGRYGTASNRPGASEVSVGDMYIDTTMKRTIWVYAIVMGEVAWVDGEGYLYIGTSTSGTPQS